MHCVLRLLTQYVHIVVDERNNLFCDYTVENIVWNFRHFYVKFFFQSYVTKILETVIL